MNGSGYHHNTTTTTTNHCYHPEVSSIVAHKLNQLLSSANDSDCSCTTNNADFVVEICNIDMSNATGSHNTDAAAKALGGEAFHNGHAC